MNTKQKLTLGIAAIFMVTLTIVGVTYAYFVTRVNDNNTETVNVQTAKLVALEYAPCDDTEVKLENALPGTKKTLAFAVKNGDAVNDQTFNITLGTKKPSAESGEFLHAATEKITSCINVLDAKRSTEEGKNADCFAPDQKYNYITVNIYEDTANCSNTPKGAAIASIKPSYNGAATYGLYETIKADITIAKATNDTTPTVNNYVMEVSYDNAPGNQNAENLAALDLKVDISQ